MGQNFIGPTLVLKQDVLAPQTVHIRNIDEDELNFYGIVLRIFIGIWERLLKNILKNEGR